MAFHKHGHGLWNSVVGKMGISQSVDFPSSKASEFGSFYRYKVHLGMVIEQL